MKFGLCCAPIGTPGTSDECNCTAENIGTGVDIYVDASVDPFQFRRMQATGDVIITTVSDPGANDSNRIHHSVALSTRAVPGNTLVATPAKTLLAGDVLLFLKRLVAGTNITFDQVLNDSFRINAAGGTVDSMANIGAGIEPYDTGTSNPFDVRRMEVIDDGSDLHGAGNLAFWQDGDTNKIDLPRAHVQNSNAITVFNTLTTLIDHTFNDDSAGANVAGKNGEDWMSWWSLKICGDPAFGGIDYVAQFQVHDGVGFVVVDSVHVRWTVGLIPSAPVCRPYLLTNTNWSVASGLRVRIQVASNNFAVSGYFEDPSIHIQRFNK
jgi:hypothetical protein